MTDDRSLYVVLADVVGSREIDDRQSFEGRLDRALDDVNEAESEDLHTPFTYMKGVDEFGCVLQRLTPIPEVVAAILDRLHPTIVRFGIGAGSVDVGVDRGTVARMDGPAFHSARAVLEAAEADDLYVGVDTGSPADGLLESALNLLVLEREDLTERQVEVCLAYERHGTQTAASEALDAPQQSISETLRRANYARRKTIRQSLRTSIESIYD